MYDLGFKYLINLKNKSYYGSKKQKLHLKSIIDYTYSISIELYNMLYANVWFHLINDQPKQL